jgi:hypothetical protein
MEPLQIVWRMPSAGVHVVEAAGRPAVVINNKLAGLVAARDTMAFWADQIPVEAAFYAAPGSAHADISMRASLRRAAALLKRPCPELSRAVASIRILQGLLVWDPSAFPGLRIAVR